MAAGGTHRRYAKVLLIRDMWVPGTGRTTSRASVAGNGFAWRSAAVAGRVMSAEVVGLGGCHGLGQVVVPVDAQVGWQAVPLAVAIGEGDLLAPKRRGGSGIADCDNCAGTGEDRVRDLVGEGHGRGSATVVQADPHSFADVPARRGSYQRIDSCVLPSGVQAEVGFGSRFGRSCSPRLRWRGAVGGLYR
jgi:hypothetical protein